MNEFRNARKRLLAIIFEQEELYNMGYEKIAVWWFFEQMFSGLKRFETGGTQTGFPRDLGSHKREWRFMQTCFPQLVSSERAKFNHWARVLCMKTKTLMSISSLLHIVCFFE